MIHRVDPATVLQYGFPLQQGELFEFINGNAVLSASLWINVALAGVSIFLFVYMGRQIQSVRAQLIWVAALLVPLISLASYLGLLSGLTTGFLEMPAGHPLAGEAVFQPWGRYLTWTFSTPMILVALGLLAGTTRAKLFTAVSMDVGMCVTGLAAALVTSSLLLRWAFYVVSCAFFAVVLYLLVVEWPRDADAAGTGEIFGTLSLLTVVLWFGYPVVWAVGTEGLALIQSVGLVSWAYSILDVFAKYVFSFLLLRWVANNESTVGTTGSAAGSGGVAPADY